MKEREEEGSLSLPWAGDATATLVAKMRAGDRNAYDVLYARYIAPLRRWARGRLPGWARDLTDTDDMVQETMLHSLQHVAVFEPRHQGAFLAYLRRGILNRITDEIRRAQRRAGGRDTAGAALDDRPSPLEELLGRESLERYEGALGRLRPEDRELILSRVELCLSYAQIAEAHDKPSPDAARMATSRALLLLAREMSRG